MKNLFILTLGLAVAASAAAHEPSTLQHLSSQTSQIYKRINNAKEIDAGMFGLDFYLKRSAQKLVLETGKCQAQSKFNLTSGDNIVLRMATNQSLALADGKIETPEAIPTESELADLLGDWTQELDAEEIRVCIIQDVPAYTDGREIVFVMINEKLEFAFGYTKPD